MSQDRNAPYMSYEVSLRKYDGPAPTLENPKDPVETIRSIRDPVLMRGTFRDVIVTIPGAVERHEVYDEQHRLQRIDYTLILNGQGFGLDVES